MFRSVLYETDLSKKSQVFVLHFFSKNNFGFRLTFLQQWRRPLGRQKMIMIFSFFEAEGKEQIS